MGAFTLDLSDILGLKDDVVVEAIEVQSKTENPETSMQISLVTDELILKSKLLPVSDPISFSNGLNPTDRGLFSNTIFGSTPETRKRQFAYIDLHETFFHPYVYEILKALMPKKFEKCASGKGSWYLNAEGVLTEADINSPMYDENNSGIRWLIDQYPKMNISTSASLVRADRLRMLKNLSSKEVFITKWLVVPVFYRDLDKNTSVRKLPEINNNYNTIIRYSNSLRDSTFDFFNNQIRFNLQQELVIIRKYAQSLIEKKHGFFHKAILGKSIDRGSRDVISVATMLNYQRPSDNPIDIFHTGIPLAKCIILGYDFIMRYCLQFFADNFRNLTEYPVYKLDKGEYKMTGSVKISDQVQRFSSKYIRKKINRFKNSHETRFEPITIETEDGKEIPIHMSGFLGKLKPGDPDSSIILNRPMTWTDLFYQACVTTLGDKCVYITRYPVTSHNSTFPSICLPLSTISTIDATIEGVHYPYYPVIDLNLPSNRISNVFNDTVTMANMMLDALGGDFDGDQTGEKLLFSVEANEEAQQIMESIKNFVAPDGKLIRVLGKEAYLTYYNLTRQEPPTAPLSDELKADLLRLKKDDLTVNSIAKLFGFTTKLDRTNKKSAFDIVEPKFNTRAKFVLEKGEYINTERITTSVGIFLFNKLMIENNLHSTIPGGYYNEVLTKKLFENLTDIIAMNTMSGKIKVKPHLIEFLTAYEFWGLSLVAIFSPSYSIETIVPNKELKAKKQQLLDAATDNSLATLSEIEDQLVKEADRLTKGTPGKYLFESGARGSFSNDFKNMAVSIGPVENAITGEYDFIKSNYMDGIAKKDLPAAANIIVAAEYPKAIGTAQGGYKTKQLYAVLQTVVADDAGTDCGTTKGLEVVLTKDNLHEYFDQYIITDKGLILIDENLPVKYLNHKEFIRSPMYCLSDKLCSKCAGQRFYNIDMQNMGLTTPSLSGSLQNASLKFRHSMKVKMDKVDENTLLL